MTSSITYNKNKKTLTGSQFDDCIYATDYFSPPDEYYSGKGLIINTGNGNDEVHDSYGYDTITCGEGDDTIYLDHASCGSLATFFIGNYNDTIIVSKNENLTIQYNLFNEEFDYEIWQLNKNDIGLYISEVGYLPNYNVWGGSTTACIIKNAIKYQNASTVTFKIGDESITFDENYKFKIFTGNKKSYIGNASDEYIGGSSYINQNIKGMNGNDTIDAGYGNDTITGGAGTNTIKYTKDYGNDTIVLTKDETAILDLYELDKDDLSYSFDKNSLIISYTDEFDEEVKAITIKDFAKENLGDVYITFDGNGITGDENIDYINLRNQKWETQAYTDKYTGNALNEKIIGQDYINQNIKSLDGDDTIDAGIGNDTITGGTGTNTIKYSNGDGNDTIVLTKDETAILDLYGITKDQLNYSFNKNDLVISYINNCEETQKITIKNFAKNDVVGEKGNVYITFEGQDILAGTENEDYINLKTKYYIYKNFTDKNKSYTSIWLTDEIDATSLNEYNIANKKGVSITAKYDTNKLTGSKYNDTIKGGNNNDTISAGGGDDVIYGGTGTNTIQFKKGDGTDTVYSTKNANDTIEFIGTSFDDLKFSQEKNNLIITGYGEETDKVIVANYYKGNSSIQNILINGITKSISQSIEEQPTEETPESGGDIHTKPYDGKHIVGTNGNNNLNGTDSNDIIHGKLGSDTIHGKGGNDTIDAFIDAKIYGDDGNDYIHIEYGFSTIYGGSGDDSLHTSGYHNEIYGEDGNDTIYANATSFVDAGKGNDEVDVNCDYPEETTIYLGDGNDTISISSSVNFANVYGDDGDDFIESSGLVCNLYGGDGNDTYEIDSSNKNTTNIIYDTAGDNDSFSFQYANGIDTVYVNVYADGTHDNSLTLISKYNEDCTRTVIIKEYFSEGKIENIPHKYNSNNEYLSEEKLNACIQEVASWLSDNDFESSQAVLDSGDETNINTLYAKFNDCWSY